MAAEKDKVTVPQLFSRLKLCGEDGEHERGIKVADKILQLVPDDKDAFRCKVVSMVHLGQFKEALGLMNKKSELSKNLNLEKAYCHYRLHQLSEALDLLKKSSSQGNAEKELRAQVLYRLEQYKDSYGMYEELMRNCDDDYVDEREANMVAMGALAVSSSTSGGGVSMEDSREDTYELCYNKACRYLSHGRVAEAEALLVKGQELCKQMLQDEDPDTSAEDIEDVLALSRMQLAYCAQLKGKTDEASKDYNNIIKSRPSDAALAAVAANNIVTINREKQVFDSQKKIKVAAAEGLERKLTVSQRKAIAFNRCLFYLYTNQGDNFRSAVTALEKQYPSDLPCLLQAAQLQREKKATKSFQLLQTYAKDHPDSAMRIQLSLAQIQLTQGNVTDAITTLSAIQSLRHRPALVSTLVTLYTESGNVAAGSELISETVAVLEHDLASESVDRKQFLALLQFAATFFLEHKQPERAVDMLLKLRQADPSRVSVIAQLVQAYSQFNPQKAEELSAVLPGLSQLTDDSLDVDKLESMSGVKQSRRAARAADTAAESSADVLKKKGKAKKKKKKRLPKNFDPDIKPDPERWLPRWERSTFQKRRHQKKKGMQVGKGTQGSAAGASDKFDASLQSAKAESPAPAETQSPSAATNVTKASTAPAAAKKKQKKKGKGKW